MNDIGRKYRLLFWLNVALGALFVAQLAILSLLALRFWGGEP